MHSIFIPVATVAALLAVVSLLLPLAQRWNFPFAVMLAVVGGAIGSAVGVLLALQATGPLGDFAQALAGFRLSSEAFIFIFLPILLFETALSVEVRRLFEEIAPVLLLAIVAVLVCTFAIGLALWPLSQVGLIPCLILGAILATTDPVAVVAVFRSTGAPKRLSILVEGESLFNDAAAITLFTLFAAMYAGAGMAGPLDGILKFIQAFGGGLALGFLAGRLTCAVLPRLREHHLAETTLTIALAYLAFVFGEHVLHVSGVVAAVSAGLVLSHEGRRRLSPSSWERLEGTWETLGFWSSSLIFLMTAMIAPGLLAEAEWHHLVLLLAVIAAAFGARAVTTFGLLPLLSAVRLSAPVGNSYKLVILWGGMRGAISLALALAVTENHAFSPEVRQFVGILATGFVLFTLLVNAPSLRWVMHALGLDRLSPAELALRDRAVALANQEIAEGVARIAREHSLNANLAEQVAARYRRPQHAAGAAPDLDAATRDYSGLAILAEREQEICRAHFENRTASRGAVANLVTRVERLREGARAGGLAGYGEAARRNLTLPRSFRLTLFLLRRFGIERPVARQLADGIEMFLVMRVVLNELLAFNEAEIAPLFGAETAATLERVLRERLAAVQQRLRAIELQYPSYAEAVERQFLAMSAVRMEDERQHRMLEDSIIPQEVFNHLQRDLRARRKGVERRAPLDLGLRSEDLVARVPLFVKLDPAERAVIAELLRPQLAAPGEVLVRAGERGDSMYFISSGAVEVQVAPEPVRLGSGDFFGELALLDDAPRTADVTALGFCQLLRLTRRDFDAVLARNPTLRDAIEGAADRRRGGLVEAVS